LNDRGGAVPSASSVQQCGLVDEVVPNSSACRVQRLTASTTKVKGFAADPTGDSPATVSRKHEPGRLEAHCPLAVGNIRAEWRRGNVEPLALHAQLVVDCTPPAELGPDRAIGLDHISRNNSAVVLHAGNEHPVPSLRAKTAFSVPAYSCGRSTWLFSNAKLTAAS
jgi:hypothetical protein